MNSSCARACVVCVCVRGYRDYVRAGWNIVHDLARELAEKHEVVARRDRRDRRRDEAGVARPMTVEWSRFLPKRRVSISFSGAIKKGNNAGFRESRSVDSCLRA